MHLFSSHLIVFYSFSFVTDWHLMRLMTNLSQKWKYAYPFETNGAFIKTYIWFSHIDKIWYIGVYYVRKSTVSLGQSTALILMPAIKCHSQLILFRTLNSLYIWNIKFSNLEPNSCFRKWMQFIQNKLATISGCIFGVVSFFSMVSTS